MKTFTLILILFNFSANAGLDEMVAWHRGDDITIAEIENMLGGGKTLMVKETLFKKPKLALLVPYENCQVSADNPLYLENFRITVEYKKYQKIHKIYTMKAYCNSPTVAILEIAERKDNDELLSLFETGLSVEVYWDKDNEKPSYWFALTKFTEQEIRLISLHDEELVKKVDAKVKELKQKHKQENEKFLVNIEKENGIQKTTTGLLYKEIKRGAETTHPSPNSNVTVLYVGKLIDGTEFDKSHEALTFSLDELRLQGWKEAIQLMTPGSKYTFFIPAELAYGEKGARGIPGDSTVIFEIELVSIN